MISYEEYVEAGGKLDDQTVFEKLEPMVCELFLAYIESSIPFWRAKSELSEYTSLDLTKPIVMQIDYIEQHGGLDAFYGNSDLNLKGVSTSGFSYTMDTSAGMFVDIPMSTIAKSNIDRQLLASGLKEMGIW